MNEAEAGTCPHFAAFNPFAPDQLADPNGVLAEARRDTPVFYAPEFGFWVVTRYEDVNRIFGDTANYSNSAVLSLRMERPAVIQEEYGDRELGLSQQLVTKDPPDHTRLKKLMSPAFLPRRVLAHEAWVRQLAHRLIDGFEARGQADFVNDYAARIPPAVIARVVGAPEEDAGQFSAWVDDILTLTGALDVPEDTLADAWRGVYAFEDYIRDLIAARRAVPADDLTTDFIQAKTDDGSPAMSDSEAMWNVFNVTAAGTDTSGVLIAQAIHLLLSHRDQWEAVRADSALIPNALEEALRVCAPVRGLLRLVTKDVEVAGVAIPANSLVMVHISSANQDDATFAEPGEFDIHRGNAKRHLGFGSRAHACIGAPLARLEARVAIEVLAERLPNLELCEDSRNLAYRPNLILPAVDSLNARW